MIKHPIRYFNNHPIIAIWDDEKSIWWYSAIDLIEALVNPNSPRRYWNNVKTSKSRVAKVLFSTKNVCCG